MPATTDQYKIPPGYSATMTLIRSIRLLNNPIESVWKNMEKFKGTYSVVVPGDQLMILTQDAGFVNHILKENHTNYHRSKFSAGRMATFFGQGLLFANGEYWLRQRRLIQPGFHQKRLRELFSIIEKTIRDFLVTMPTGKSIDMYPVIHQLAFQIVIKSLFNIPLSAKTMADLTGTFNEVQEFVVRDMNHPLRKILYPVTGAERSSLQKSTHLREIFKEIVDQRRKDGQHYGDLLDMLLEARYEDNGEPMSDDQLLDEIQVLVFAGHETTADTLSWLLHLLASSPETIDRLKARIDAIDPLDSPKDDLFNAVINEGMRLYPAGWMTDRVSLNDDAYGEFSFPKGTIIVSYFFGMHRDPRYWDAPSEYRPDRFLDAGGKLIKVKNFFPFGAGPRMCIGNNFALAEMGIFLHAFFKEFNVKSTGQIPIKKPLITLRPDKVILDVERIP